MKKLLKGVAWSLGAILGIVFLLYLVALAVNWRDRPPSEAALHMRRLLDERPAVAHGDNAFILFLGFSAPMGVDPQAAGIERLGAIEAWNRKLLADAQRRQGPQDEGRHDTPRSFEDEELRGPEFPTLTVLRERCPGEPVDCRAAFETLAAGPPFTGAERRYLDRYRQLIDRRLWRETIPFDMSMALPRYGDVVAMQRLMLLDLRRRAQPGAAAEIRAALHADLEFWREMQKSADYLITKMVAGAGIRQHFFFGNLVVRALPPAQQLAALPEAWSREMSAQERALQQVLAGELRFSEVIIRGWMNDPASGLDEDLPSRITAALSRPFFQPQDQLNHHAAQYLAFAERFAAPLTQYPALVEEAERRGAAAEIDWSLYNPIGHYLRALNGDWSFAKYAVRVGSLEGIRRAALLTTRLRAARVPTDLMPRHIREDILRNPFDERPFEWSEAEQALVYAGPEQANVTRHVYFY